MEKLIENVADRFISTSKKGKISYTDELEILQYLVKRYNLLSQSEYARLKGITPAAVYKRIKNGKEMSINLAGRELIIN